MSYFDFDIIQTAEHRIQACGPSTGHTVKTVAMCDSAALADFLLRGVEAMSALASHTSALAERDAEIKAALDALSKEADQAYCQSLDQFQKPECLGWAAKAHAGKFGNAEHLGHKRANELMGRHQGIVHALQVIRAALAKEPTP